MEVRYNTRLWTICFFCNAEKEGQEVQVKHFSLHIYLVFVVSKTS